DIDTDRGDHTLQDLGHHLLLSFGASRQPTGRQGPGARPDDPSSGQSGLDGRPPLLSFQLLHAEFASISSTRRFCARPCPVSFEATGSCSPYPLAEIMSSFTPWEIRYCITLSARFSDSTWFESMPWRRS